MPRDKQPTEDLRARRMRVANRAAGGIIVIGTGIAAATGAIWPGILLVLALSVVPVGFAAAGWLGALMPALWLVGLAMAVAMDLFWPGVLVLVISTLVLRMLIRRARRTPPRRKGSRR